MEDYFDAKMRLFTRAYSSCAVINMDDPRSSDVIDHAKSQDMRIITVSCTNPDADVFVEVKDITLSGMVLSVTYNLDESETHNIETSLIGQFNAENIALVLGLAHANGCDRTLSCRALNSPRSVPGRLERIESNEDFAVFVDYAHTPDALETRAQPCESPCQKNNTCIWVWRRSRP
jgi:UDP-N-acetylmuramoyl-L-alanyl-D-glutamate--2,6-diaminopimelate ligase